MGEWRHRPYDRERRQRSAGRAAVVVVAGRRRLDVWLLPSLWPRSFSPFLSAVLVPGRRLLLRLPFVRPRFSVGSAGAIFCFFQGRVQTRQ